MSLVGETGEAFGRPVQRRIAPTAPHSPAAVPDDAQILSLPDGSYAGRPEIRCLRQMFPARVLWAAERRGDAAGTGADRALIAAGAIGEEAYLRALAADLGIAYQDLEGIPRSACPLSDERLPEALIAGVLPLKHADENHWIFAPRNTSSRQLVQLLAQWPALSARVQLTSQEHLRHFVTHHAADLFAHQAADALRTAMPAQSAAPGTHKRRRLPWALAAAGMTAALFVFPWQTLAVCNVTLAAIFLSWIALRIVGAVTRPEQCERVDLPDHNLPVYTIIAALYREAASVEALVASIRALDYPPEKLDIKFALEADDAETRAALEAIEGGPPFEIVIAPARGPRTKPKALNAALASARGTFAVVFDAEDRPEPDQLRRALDAFLAGGESLSCVQARLAIDNTDDSWLARLFTAEYAGQFDVFLPGLSALRLPLPLGGSSNHFRTSILRQAGAWDPYNVTEDADLGMRLARYGFRTATIASTTDEEAPARLLPWLRQRTRWFKGWLQTWLVHMRAPLLLYRELGWAGFATFQLVVGGTVLAALIHPVFLAGFAYALAMGFPIGDGVAGAVLAGTYITAIVAGYLVSILLGLVGLSRRNLLSSAWILLLVPLHWVLLSIAAWRALLQLLRDPYRWEKTAHGLARTSRRAAKSG